MFHPFSRLPLELRLKIWGLTCPKPCVVLCGRTVCYRYEEEAISTTFFSVIHACREARNEMLNGEPASVLTAKWPHPRYEVCCFGVNAQRAIFSFEVDTLDLPARDLAVPSWWQSTHEESPRCMESHRQIKRLSTDLAGFVDIFESTNSDDDEDSDSNQDPSTMLSLPDCFPSLELITFKADLAESVVATGNPMTDQLIAAMKRRQNTEIQQCIEFVKEMFEIAGEKRPEWKIPELRFRDEQEFLKDPLGYGFNSQGSSR